MIDFQSVAIHQGDRKWMERLSVLERPEDALEGFAIHGFFYLFFVSSQITRSLR
jgi:hypothetical protein